MKRALVVVACAASLLAAACGPPRPGGAELAADVKTMREERTPDKLLARGKAFYSIGDLTRAEQYFAAALDAGAPEKEALPLLLRVCSEGRRYRVAIEYAEPYLKKHPTDHRLRMVVASLWAAAGDADRARTEYESVVAAHPDEALAHYQLGVLLRDTLHDVVGADGHFREYLRIEPKGPHAEEARASLLKSVP